MADAALDWFVGDELARLFTKHFKLPATISEMHQTPYMAFVMATCEEANVFMDKATVVDIGRRHGLREEEPDDA